MAKGCLVYRLQKQSVKTRKEGTNKEAVTNVLSTSTANRFLICLLKSFIEFNQKKIQSNNFL